MEIIVLALFYMLSGFLMKFSDDAYDEMGNKKLAAIVGIICGLCIGFLVVNSVDATYIFFAILLGTLFSKKIDGVHHILTLATFVLVAFIYGFPQISILTLIICSIAAFIDEIGNDNQKLIEKNHFLEVFFRYRFAMKITIFSLAFLGLYQSLTGFDMLNMEFLSFSAFFLFILFEISYEFTGRYFERSYNWIKNYFLTKNIFIE
ncbi:MAG: hypothetical protein CVV28_01100 [Methanobacteriales archaeon HGW-Methanobacteriales-1]|jgi:hypothetical protein|nr:MAG: hypothetical protein CVV28_01100 [Methanobacteriales archaeon HGW-Methanobacteriales-1]